MVVYHSQAHEEKRKRRTALMLTIIPVAGGLLLSPVWAPGLCERSGICVRANSALPSSPTSPTSPPTSSPLASPASSPSAKAIPLDPSAAARCARGEKPDVDGLTVEEGDSIDASYIENPTRGAGIAGLHKGDVYRIEASGSIWFAAVGKAYGPGGSGTLDTKGYPQYGSIVAFMFEQEAAGDVAGWSGIPAVAVGKLSVCTKAPANSTRLIFWTNEQNDHKGNTGHWNFRILVYHLNAS